MTGIVWFVREADKTQTWLHCGNWHRSWRGWGAISCFHTTGGDASKEV